ncbi:MAG: hypothetical protein HYY06_02540 [Deltaproteobacteria bacterium]|nr:hypothetical protein [Deltaproteobacteria bacterium]
MTARLALFLAALLTACGSSRRSAPARAGVASPAAPPMAPEPRPEAAPPTGPTSPEVAAAVSSRLAGIRAPGIDGTGPLASLSERGSRACSWLRRVGGRPRSVTCSDGSTFVIGLDDLGGCEPDMFEHLRGCAVTLHEAGACLAGIRERSCDGGLRGANLLECQPVQACFRHQASLRLAGSPLAAVQDFESLFGSSEPEAGVNAIARRTVVYHGSERAGPGGVGIVHRMPPRPPRTPATPPCGPIPWPTTPDPGWTAIDFWPEAPVRYSYELEIAQDEKSFVARATGDLDCDGRYSRFERTGSVVADSVVLGPLTRADEAE